jgi:hypothetical protein
VIQPIAQEFEQLGQLDRVLSLYVQRADVWTHVWECVGVLIGPEAPRRSSNANLPARRGVGKELTGAIDKRLALIFAGPMRPRGSRPRVWPKSSRPTTPMRPRRCAKGSTTCSRSDASASAALWPRRSPRPTASNR